MVKGRVARAMRPLARLQEVWAAFFRLGFLQAVSYPLSFSLGQLSALMPAFIFFFVARLVERPGGPAGGDYYTFVVIGLIAARVLDTGIRAFSSEVDAAINRGWLELFLVEPIRWRYLPLALGQWQVVQGSIGAVLIAGVSLTLGATFRLEGLLVAILILLLGLAAGMAIGTLSASLKVLAKGGDPVLFLYSLAAQIFSGVYFPLEILPAPLRPISLLLPHTYVILALRRVLMPAGQELPGLSAGQAVVVLVVFSAVMYPVALWLFGRALNYGRKLGVLTGY